MRWIWIDRFVEFESGARAVAVKNITLAEECMADHFPDYPVYPATLMIEGMAQTAGILVGEARSFQENVILAKIRRAEFTGLAVPGDQILFEATLENLDERSAVTSGIIRNNGETVGQVDLMFSHVRATSGVHDLPAHNFVFTDQFLTLLDAFRQN